MMQTAPNSQPRSRLMTLIAVRKLWNTDGNSIDVIAAYCTMICVCTIGREQGARVKNTTTKTDKTRPLIIRLCLLQ